MGFSNLVSNRWVSKNNINDAISNGLFFTTSNYSITNDDSIITVKELLQNVYVDHTNNTLSSKILTNGITSSQFISKQDMTKINNVSNLLCNCPTGYSSVGNSFCEKITSLQATIIGSPNRLNHYTYSNYSTYGSIIYPFGSYNLYGQILSTTFSDNIPKLDLSLVSSDSLLYSCYKDSNYINY